MRNTESVTLNPIATEKTVRNDEVRVLTSARAGKIIPLKFIPLLREDRVTRGNIRVTVDMAETVFPLMNSTNLTVYVHFVPYLALPDFKEYGMETFNRSYMNQPEPGGGAVKPFVKTHKYDRASIFYKTLGIHWRQGFDISSFPINTFKELVNFRRQARSENLPEYNPTTDGLPAAFWKHGDMMQIVPNYDQAAMDGEVELSFSQDRLPVRSKEFQLVDPGATRRVPVGSPGFTPTSLDGGSWYSWASEIFVEMKSAGISVSLANIELAKKTAAFAKLRDKYPTIDAEHVIDLLMQGVRVPDEALKQPILLDKKSTIFGYQERHAMDGASLEKSVTTGQTSVDLNFRLPETNTGGIIWITAEIVPEQLFERKRDKYLGIDSANQFPNFLTDYLDPEKVDIVRNEFADVNHGNPGGTFGYAPLNHEWRRSFANIGGKYFRPTPDSFVEDRQKFWAVEQLNPSLTADFYLVNNLPHSVFMDTLSDAFEILCTGDVNIVGNTVFGKTLEEDQDSYNIINNIVDKERHVLPE